MAEKLFQFKANELPAKSGGSASTLAPVRSSASSMGRLFYFTNIETGTETESIPTPSPPTMIRPILSFSAPSANLSVKPAPASAPLTSLQTPKPLKKSEDEVFKSLMKTEEKTLEKKKSVLGELPKIDTSLFIDREYHLKKQLSVVRFIFAFLLLASFGMYVFFYSQLTPTFDFFGQNVAQKLEDKNSQLKNLQTELNLFRIQIAQILLDRFTYLGDNFLKKFNEYQVAQTDAKKAELLADIQSIREEMYEPFEKAREKLLAQNFVALFRTDTVTELEAEREFDQYLRDKLLAERTEKTSSLQSARQSGVKEQLETELLRNSELLQLVGKPKMKTLLQGSIRKMTDEEFQKFLAELASAYPNRLGFIYQIKEKRVPWARAIREIDQKTKIIDPLFRTGFFDKLGGILYTSFDFNAATSRIAINGRAKSEDGTNFSVLANLIDELEGSAIFKDIDMRSFSKRPAENGSYEGSFKVDFFLQNNGADEKDKKYNL